MLEVKLNIHKSWLDILQKEFEKNYFSDLLAFIKQEQSEFDVYPEENLIFDAFNQTPFNNVKVVLIGQDPYHGPNQANGLSFSVKQGIKAPPSLRNIFKELKSDLNIETPNSGDLGSWAKNGVLMLNATLTVRAKTPGSHQNRGWEEFTDAVITKLSNEKENLVFILWGKYAQKKGVKIDKSKHFVIESAHPSPFAARKGFFESKPFSKTNNFLQSKGIKTVDWKL